MSNLEHLSSQEVLQVVSFLQGNRGERFMPAPSVGGGNTFERQARPDYQGLRLFIKDIEGWKGINKGLGSALGFLLYRTEEHEELAIFRVGSDAEKKLQLYCEQYSTQGNIKNVFPVEKMEIFTPIFAKNKDAHSFIVTAKIEPEKPTFNQMWLRLSEINSLALPQQQKNLAEFDPHLAFIDLLKQTELAEEHIDDNVPFESPKIIDGDEVKVAWATVPNPKRVHENQDRAVVASTSKGTVYLVGIDAMGGHEKPAAAATAAAESFVDSFKNGASPEKAQQAAAGKIAREVDRRAGFTYAAVRIENKQLSTAHAGDFRVFVIRNGSIILATQDESVLNSLKNAVSGVNPGATRREATGFSLQSGDTIVMVDDGITDNMLEDQPYTDFVNHVYPPADRMFKLGVDQEKAQPLFDQREQKVLNILSTIVAQEQTPEGIIRKIGLIVQKNMKDEGAKLDDATIMVTKVK